MVRAHGFLKPKGFKILAEKGKENGRMGEAFGFPKSAHNGPRGDQEFFAKKSLT